MAAIHTTGWHPVGHFAIFHQSGRHQARFAAGYSTFPIFIIYFFTKTGVCTLQMEILNTPLNNSCRKPKFHYFCIKIFKHE
jgi:hypothetical protein